MSMLNDLKRLLFGAKSVAESAVDKAVETGKEKGEELMEKSGELIHKALDKAEEIGSEVSQKAGVAFEKAKNKVEELVDEFMEKPETTASPEAPAAPQSPATPPPPQASATTPFAAPGEASGEEVKLLPEEISSDDVPQDKGADPGLQLPSSVEELGKKVMSTAEEIGGKVLEKAGEAGQKIAGAAEEIGHKIFHSGEGAGDKIMGKAEELGSKVIDATGDLWEKAKTAGSSFFDKANDLVEKAQDAAAKEGNLDDTIKGAQDLNDKLEQKAKDTSGGFFHSPVDTKNSTLDSHDDFFERAKRFAEGDYHGTGSSKLSGKPDAPAPKEGKLKGFEDHDGDGDELIDDAIIDEN